MPNLHIIIGDSNTRKSSLLRCLTGVGGGNAQKDMSVTLANGNVIVIHCILSALQENYKPKTPAEFINYINSLQQMPTDIAFTLRVSAQGNYPQALAYLQSFTQLNWQITNITLLGASACNLQGLQQFTANIAQVVNSQNQPTNATANQVRQTWGWL